MTLTEYLNQADPQRLSSGAVVLQDNEIQVIATLRPKLKPAYTRVYVDAVGYGYVIVEGSNILRTVDEDGNVKGYSVFAYDLPNKTI